MRQNNSNLYTATSALANQSASMWGAWRSSTVVGSCRDQGNGEVSTILPQKFVKIRHYTLWRLKLLTEWRRENQRTSRWRRSVEPSASCHVAKVYAKVLNTSTGNYTPCRIKFLNQSNVKLCTLKRKEEQSVDDAADHSLLLPLSHICSLLILQGKVLTEVMHTFWHTRAPPFSLLALSWPPGLTCGTLQFSTEMWLKTENINIFFTCPLALATVM